jgi:predicted RNA-binding protein associated with RNAse of E/G family
MTRKIPIISLEDFEAKAKKPTMMRSLVSNIAEGIEDNLESVNIAEIKNHDIILSVSKDEWKPGLENAMDYYIEREEYEECSKIKKLIEKIK